ncbi:GNAT family N-acetyltransferase [Brevundimonas sp. Leaf363]|uniref:GNAT family N-acetyltransferase n=1 Tax=Brevundimonas sp. Leaf363 TaxID=1736353 RepID=UPI000B00C8E1|nr:GNAT family N-acetyltransferase [Brevundimonas sp. Leaf363]
MSQVVIRDVEPGDMARIAAIYAESVENGLGTFELDPPDEAEMVTRFAAVAASGLPRLVAEIDGQIAGYAYAGVFRPRRGYRYTVEDSVYIDPAFRGRGVGRALLSALIERCEALGLRQMLAVIGDSANAGSVALHAACGFEPCGVLNSVGWKHNDWRDVVLMQRALGPGGDAEPTSDGLPGGR